MDISLLQSGYPIISSSQFKPTPVIVDLEEDGIKDIILGDYAGLVHRYTGEGIEIFDNTYPYDTGNQIWGSPASADIDLDGDMDVIISSKSK